MEPSPFNLIESDPAILQGKPCIKGTRISVEFVLQLLASGASSRFGRAIEAPGLPLSCRSKLARPVRCVAPFGRTRRFLKLAKQASGAQRTFNSSILRLNSNE